MLGGAEATMTDFIKRDKRAGIKTRTHVEADRKSTKISKLLRR